MLFIDTYILQKSLDAVYHFVLVCFNIPRFIELVDTCSDCSNEAKVAFNTIKLMNKNAKNIFA